MRKLNLEHLQDTAFHDNVSNTYLFTGIYIEMNTQIKEQKQHFGLYALIINTKEDKILLIEKARGPYTGLLDLPGGRPEFDETFEETLSREVQEETGLSITSAKQIKTLLRITEYEEYTFRHVGIIYLTTITGKLCEHGDGQDSNGAVWISIDELNQKNCTPFVRDIINNF